jgi:hypothetical protein
MVNTIGKPDNNNSKERCHNRGCPSIKNQMNSGVTGLDICQSLDEKFYNENRFVGLKQAVEATVSGRH